MPKTLLRLCLGASMAAPLAPAIAASPWKLLTSVPGGVVANLVFDSKSSGIALAGSSGGVIYRSTDGGSRWTPIKVGNITETFRTICFSPQKTAQDAFAVSDDAGVNGGRVFVSHDEGVTWSALTSQPSAIAPFGALFASRGIAVDPTGNIIVLTDIAQGVFRSSDRGSSWSNPLTEGDGIHGLAVDPTSPNTLWAGGTATVTQGKKSTTYPAAYQSNDFGATWLQFPIKKASGAFISGLGFSIEPVTGDLFLNYDNYDNNTGLFQGNVVRSTTDGSSWVSLAAGLPVDFDSTNSSTGFAFDSTQKNTLLLGSNSVPGSDGLLKSIDNGKSWQGIGTALPTGGAYTVVSRPATPDYDAALFAGWDGLFMSLDHGVSWAPSQSGLISSQLGNIADDGVTARGFYGCGLGGLFHTTNAGVTWSPIVSWPGVHACLAMAVDRVGGGHSVYASNGQTIWRGAGGNNWVDVSPPIPAGSYITQIYVDPAVSGRLYALGGSSTIYMSSDSGGTWTSSMMGNAGDEYFGLFAASKTPGLLYSVLSSGLWHSTDAGVSWTLTAAQPALFINALAIEGATPYRLVVGGYPTGEDESTLLISSDGAQTFTAPSGYNAYTTGFIVASPSNATLVVGDCFSNLYISKNGGTQWTQATLPIEYLSQFTCSVSATNKDVFLSDYSGALLSVAYSGL